MKYLILLSLIFLCACENQNKQLVHIAILTPVTHPSLKIIEKGFIEEMEARNPGRYHFVTYNAQGNKTLMHSEVEEIARQDYALVLTIGTAASQMTKEVFAKKNLKTPVVFTCVNDPLGFHIVSSESTRDEDVTGVKEMLDFQQELSFLLKYKPDVKNILLVINPAEPGLQKDQKEIENILKKTKITRLRGNISI